MVTSI